MVQRGNGPPSRPIPLQHQEANPTSKWQHLQFGDGIRYSQDRHGGHGQVGLTRLLRLKSGFEGDSQ